MLRCGGRDPLKPGTPNQALEKTRNSVLRYREIVGCELLNFFEGSAEQYLSLYLLRSCNLVTIRRWQEIARVPTIKMACYSFTPRGPAHLELEYFSEKNISQFLIQFPVADLMARGRDLVSP
jgi:hypothetical protein